VGDEGARLLECMFEALCCCRDVVLVRRLTARGPLQLLAKRTERVEARELA